METKNVEHKWTVQDIPSQAGRLAVVTGATSGVGSEQEWLFHSLEFNS
jgi:hypothetical protein